MFEGVKIAGVILLCLAQTLFAGPRPFKEKTGSDFHYTKIGDISSQDLLHLADSTSPDSDVINPEQIDDPYENNIEAETQQYAKTQPVGDTPYLASPKDQEQKFVKLLTKQYKGTFPEYGEETKSDFAKNKELEDNLSVQPETVYFGHSDVDNDKSGKKEGINSYPIPDEDELENPATFDEDLKLLNTDSLEGKLSSTTTPQDHSNSMSTENSQNELWTTGKRPSEAGDGEDTTQSVEDILSEYGDSSANEAESDNGNTMTTEEHKSTTEKDENSGESMDDDEKEHATDNMDDGMSEHVTDHPTDDMEDHTTDHETSHVTDHMTNGIGGHVTDHATAGRMSDHVSDHMTDAMDDKVSELEKLREKTDEEALWDAEEKLRQELARKKKNKKQKQQDKKKEKENEKEKDSPEAILKDFDELQKNNTKTSEKHEKSHGSSQTAKDKGKTKVKLNNEEKSRKNIKNVQADESQGAGDAILDFLDKLLERDPKQLKHDVLAMTKEIQKEGTPSPSSAEKSRKATDDEAASNSDSPHATKDKQQETTETTKVNEKPDDVDNWFLQLENNVDETLDGVKEGKQNEKEMTKQNEGIGENYDDLEYDQFHDGALDIYSDGGQNMNDEQEEEDKRQKAKEDKMKEDKMKEDKMKEDKLKEDKMEEDKKKKQEDEFDYEEFKEEALKMHNEYRRRHNAAALTWSDSLAKTAKESAKKLLEATRRVFKRALEKHGENIAILPYSNKDIAKKAVEKWYAEITKFSFTSPSVKPETRDFTQIIWKASKEVGMGFVHTADRKKTLVVALYSPSGNDELKLRENLNTVNDEPYSDIK